MLLTLFTSGRFSKPKFEKVVDEELAVLYRVARRLALNDTDAEDLVSQTLYLAAKAWERFDGEHVRSWLIQILRNEHLGRIRKSARHPEVALEDVHELSEDGFWVKIDHQLIHSEILIVVDKLPEEYRLAVVLCDIEGMTRQDAATALEISEGTINSRLHRGRNILRAQLARQFGKIEN